MKKPNIYDVAKKTGVSSATVSKVLNNKGNISDQTKSKIFEAAEEINYYPHAMASALRGKKTHTIGLLIPDIGNAFFAELARNVEDTGHEHHFSVVMCNTDNQPHKEDKYLQWLNQKRLDGLIFGTGLSNSTSLVKMLEAKMPVAMAGRFNPSIDADAVLVDDFLGGYQATRHLLELGHQNIIFLLDTLKNPSSLARIEGAKKAFSETNVAWINHLIVENNWSAREAEQSLTHAFRTYPELTAAFALNDYLAVGSLEAAMQSGREVPRDFSVVGFDDTFISRLREPHLTTVAQPIGVIGKTITEKIIARINGEESSVKRTLLKPELRVRESTGHVFS